MKPLACVLVRALVWLGVRSELVLPTGALNREAGCTLLAGGGGGVVRGERAGRGAAAPVGGLIGDLEEGRQSQGIQSFHLLDIILFHHHYNLLHNFSFFFTFCKNHQILTREQRTVEWGDRSKEWVKQKHRGTRIRLQCQAPLKMRL